MISESIGNARFMVYFFLLIADLITYLYLLLKIYRVLCVSKLILDRFPLINPYKGPVSIIRIITRPYFKLWEKIMPTLRVGKGSYDVSAIIGLEAISLFLTILLKCRALCLNEAHSLLLDLE